jgi:hypothetical protein
MSINNNYAVNFKSIGDASTALFPIDGALLRGKKIAIITEADHKQYIFYREDNLVRLMEVTQPIFEKMKGELLSRQEVDLLTADMLRPYASQFVAKVVQSIVLPQGGATTSTSSSSSSPTTTSSTGQTTQSDERSEEAIPPAKRERHAAQVNGSVLAPPELVLPNLNAQVVQDAKRLARLSDEEIVTQLTFYAPPLREQDKHKSDGPNPSYERVDAITKNPAAREILKDRWSSIAVMVLNKLELGDEDIRLASSILNGGDQLYHYGCSCCKDSTLAEHKCEVTLLRNVGQYVNTIKINSQSQSVLFLAARHLFPALQTIELEEGADENSSVKSFIEAIENPLYKNKNKIQNLRILDCSKLDENLLLCLQTACPDMKKLQLANSNTINDEKFYLLESMALLCPELEALEFSDFPNLEGNGIEEFILQHNKLQHVTITKCPLFAGKLPLIADKMRKAGTFPKALTITVDGKNI